MEKLILTRGGRLDRVLAEELSLSRTKAQEIIARGVLINGKSTTKSGACAKAGTVLEYETIRSPSVAVTPNEVTMKIVYEDEYLFIIDKPRGVVVHPAPGHHDDTLVNGLAFLSSGYNEYLDQSDEKTAVRPGIVHRIDKDTSGLLIVAKDDKTASTLAGMISRHEVQREYFALVYGQPPHDRFLVDAPIGRSKQDRTKMSIDVDRGRHAVTHFTVCRRYNGVALLKARLETGRTHQIRVHLSYSNLPIVGDNVYGRKKEKEAMRGQCLHAYKLGFVHPITKRFLTFYSPLDDYFKSQIRRFWRY